METKEQVRRALLGKRKSLSLSFIEASSHRASLHFFSLEEFNLADRIAIYAACHNEIQTREIFLRANALRKEVFLPAVDKKTNLIQFFRVKDWEDLIPGYSGILEPSQQNPLSNVNYLNLIVVPGVAFDKKGNRLGFGQGFYDRLLSTFNGKKIGLAYDFQLGEDLPVQSKDVRMDMIVTEERVLKVV